MNADVLIDAYIANGVNAVNEALRNADDHTQLVLLEELESRGFFVKWHYSSDGPKDERDSGVVLEGPSDLITDAKSR